MFTHVVMAVSVAALLLTAAVLLSLRSLKSNMRGIHANVAAALGVAAVPWAESQAALGRTSWSQHRSFLTM